MFDKNNFFKKKKLLNCRDHLLDLSVPKVMGILNVTPDSFFQAENLKFWNGEKWNETPFLKTAAQMLKAGAAILDVGGMSSRPGAKIIDEKAELKRVLPAVKALSKHFPEAVISIDTIRAKVAEAALENGAAIVNDISAGRDPQIMKVAANHKAPYILMHMQGLPENMQAAPSYDNVVTEVMDFLVKKTATAREAGINDVIIDPGFGFGKTVEHNYKLMSRLSDFQIMEQPILVGISRKSMICKVLKVNPEKALTGSTALHTVALLKGADILRVHDVKEAVETIKVTGMIDE